MPTEEAQVEAEQRRRAWLIRIADKIDVAAELFPKGLRPAEERSPWVENVDRAVGSVLLPEAQIKAIKERSDLTTKRFGALVGHMCAMAVWTMEWLSHEIAKAAVNEATTLTEQERAASAALMESMAQWYEALKRAAKFALCSSVEQTYEDMTDFLLGYANAFARKPKSFKVGDIGGGTTFEIYLFLLWFWRPVERLGTVRKLHEVLGKVFGPYRIGDLKRVEKICERIDLHYGKPGRPRRKA